MWVYDKDEVGRSVGGRACLPLFHTPSLSLSHTHTQGWRNYTKQESCYKDPAGRAWADREKTRCTTHWPTGRAGHVSVLDRNLFYVHGGFRTYFPYPNTHSEGALDGVSSAGVCVCEREREGV